MFPQIAPLIHGERGPVVAFVLFSLYFNLFVLIFKIANSKYLNMKNPRWLCC